MAHMDPRALGRTALVTILLLVGGSGRASEFGFTEASPSKDEPPALTRSSKVQPSHDPSQPPALGPNPSKVLVVEFCDFSNADCVKMADAMLNDCAKKAGLNEKRYEKDFNDPALRQRARAEGDVLQALGARTAPAWSVNGRLYVRWASSEILRGAVEKERKAVDALVAEHKKLPEIQVERAKHNTRNEEAFEAYQATSLAPMGIGKLAKRPVH